MTTQPIIPSASFAEAQSRFLDLLGQWARDCAERYAYAEPTNGHDQMTFVTGWEPYLLARPDPTLIKFLKDSRDRIANYFTARGQWRHGYWTMQEAHHGTEHFELFLGFLWRIDPDDPDTVAHFVDAAEHIVNGSDDAPAWWDENTGLFKSLCFAAAAIRAYRRKTGDARYDAAVLEGIEEADPFGFESIGMERGERTKRKPPGIGKRSDAPRWFEDGEPRRRSPVRLALAAELLGDEALAVRAVDLARAYFEIAREHFPDGRQHGCAASTISAIARGHGRDNNTGMATGVLGPLMEAFGGP